MDPQTLPPAELAIYTRLKEQYALAFEPLKIRDQRLNLLKMTDLEQALDGKDPLKHISDFPFWIRLWEAAIVLSDLLVGQKPEPGTTLLELGAGLGAPGLAAASVGYQVTLSDYQEMILDFERVSAAASGLDRVEFALLDWLAPPQMEKFDIIVGAEILFREEFFEPLLNVLRVSLKPGGVIYLAHDIKRQSVQPFLHLAEKEYQISASKRKLKSLEEVKHILLTRLTPRN